MKRFFKFLLSLQIALYNVLSYGSQLSFSNDSEILISQIQKVEQCLNKFDLEETLGQANTRCQLSSILSFLNSSSINNLPVDQKHLILNSIKASGEISSKFSMNELQEMSVNDFIAQSGSQKVAGIPAILGIYFSIIALGVLIPTFVEIKDWTIQVNNQYQNQKNPESEESE